mmetsp:Transcript_13331/g.25137  ORF Transcript_13331/g.25137 Transcript_13331/m.25137 type:complete len:115 (-) Transcript_13331:488-832(-)
MHMVAATITLRWCLLMSVRGECNWVKGRTEVEALALSLYRFANLVKVIVHYLILLACHCHWKSQNFRNLAEVQAIEKRQEAMPCRGLPEAPLKAVEVQWSCSFLLFLCIPFLRE